MIQAIGMKRKTALKTAKGTAKREGELKQRGSGFVLVISHLLFIFIEF
jgi:hypothetical protein